MGRPPEDEPYSNSDIDTRKVTVTFIKDETGAEMRRVDMTLPQLAEHIAITDRRQQDGVAVAQAGDLRKQAKRKELPAHQ